MRVGGPFAANVVGGVAKCMPFEGMQVQFLYLSVVGGRLDSRMVARSGSLGIERSSPPPPRSSLGWKLLRNKFFASRSREFANDLTECGGRFLEKAKCRVGVKAQFCVRMPRCQSE